MLEITAIPVSLIILGFLIVVCVVLVGLIFIIEKFKQKKYNPSNTRPLILYLREFALDNTYIEKKPIWLVESLFKHQMNLKMKYKLDKIGQFVGVGEHEKRMVEFDSNGKVISKFWGDKLGPRSIYFRDIDWQTEITKLIHKSAFIIVRIGLSEGLSWELKTIIENNCLSKTVIYIGSSSDSLVIGKTLYECFTENNKAILPKLPEFDFSKKFIWFDDALIAYPAETLFEFPIYFKCYEDSLDRFRKKDHLPHVVIAGTLVTAFAVQLYNIGKIILPPGIYSGTIVVLLFGFILLACMKIFSTKKNDVET